MRTLGVAGALGVGLAMAVEAAPADELPDRGHVTLPNGEQIIFVRIPAGSFRMGSLPTDRFQTDIEQPQHEVTLESFYLGVTEVTVRQYEAFVEATGHAPPEPAQPSVPSEYRIPVWASQQRSPNHPVVGISWNDALAFCGWLTETKRGTFRLPTESEWEYACRAGTTTMWSTGDTLEAGQANCLFQNTPPPPGPVDVACFPPNAWGLHDMHGNVWEWCQDCYVDRYDRFGEAPADGSARRNPWPERMVSNRSSRGGNWKCGYPNVRSAYRWWCPPSADGIPPLGDLYRVQGFRVVLDFSPDAQVSPEDWADGLHPDPPDPPVAIPDVSDCPEEFANSLGMRMRLIPAGTFTMGHAMRGEDDTRETPAHEVVVGAFYMGVHEVTVAQYGQFLAATGHPIPGDFRWRDTWAQQQPHPNHPAVSIQWDDAMAFCAWLSASEEGTYRLPSEAQWEYAYRAGTTTRFYTGDSLPPNQANIDRMAGPNGERLTIADGPMDVGGFPPNPWGLCDMIGNAPEWCWDSYHWGYEGAPDDGSPWLDPPTRARPIRGGSWSAGPGIGNATLHLHCDPDEAGHNGFRVTWVPMEPQRTNSVHSSGADGVMESEESRAISAARTAR